MNTQSEHQIADEVIAMKDADGPYWQVVWKGKVLKPTFNAIGPARAYLKGLQDGKRKPT